MNNQGTVLTKEQFGGAPIERAHLHRGFSSKKTPIKWIKFFRSCVLQRQNANAKKKKEIKRIWLIVGALIVLNFVMNYFVDFPLFIIDIVAIVVAIVFTIRTNKKFKKNYTDGFDFFSDYFSAFFTLIEEDLIPQSRINLTANLRETKGEENLIRKEQHESKAYGFLSGTNYFYEREISKGNCMFNDGSVINFNFTERLRNRIVKKRSSSGKRKVKSKYKSTYPFILKMKIPKSKYALKTDIDTSNLQLAEDSEFYVIKTIRKFDIRNEEPEKYDPYDGSSISMFSSDYFALELINLINISYSCVAPRG